MSLNRLRSQRPLRLPRPAPMPFSPSGEALTSALPVGSAVPSTAESGLRRCPPQARPKLPPTDAALLPRRGFPRPKQRAATPAATKPHLRLARRRKNSPCQPPRRNNVDGPDAMASKIGVVLRPENVAAATPEKGEAAVVVEAWDGSKSPTELQLFKLLTSLNAGEKPLREYIHKANAYAAAPQDLVNGRRHAPGTGHGKESSWYFHSQPAPIKEGKRTRMVGGGTWHPEAGAKHIRGADGESVVANKRTFSYMKKSLSGMETASKGRQRTGWIMVEIQLDKQTDGADHMVLCVVYKSKKKYPDTSMAAASPGCDGEASVHESVGFSSGDIPAVPKPAPSIDTAGTTKILLQKAAEKAASCHFEKVCEIKEFVDFKERHMRTIDQLGLERPIISGSLLKLELYLQHVAKEKILTPTERDHIVSCGEDMSTTIFSAYFNELRKRAKQDFSALCRIGLSVPCHVWEKEAKATNDSSVVHDSQAKHLLQVLLAALIEVGFLSKVNGAESECPMPVNLAICSGDKRKADDHHPEAPPALRQEKDGIGRSSVVDETQNTAFSDDTAGDLNCAMDTGTQFYEVQPEQPLSLEDCLSFPNAVDNGYIIQFGNVAKGVVPEVHPEQQVLPVPVPDVGEGSSGAPNFLEETEIRHHTIKDPNHGALRRIGHGMNSDNNDYLTPSEDSAMKIPVFVDHNRLVGGDNGGYPPAAAGLAASRLEDDGLMFNEDDCNFLDGTMMEEHQVGGDNSGYAARSAARILEEACLTVDENGNYTDRIIMDNSPLSPFRFG